MKVDPLKNGVLIAIIASALAAAVILDVTRSLHRPEVAALGTRPCPSARRPEDRVAMELFCTGRLPINEAAPRDLIRLRGVGPAGARAIVEYRREHGPLHGPSDLMRVKGFGPATVERLAPLLDFRLPAGPTP